MPVPDSIYRITQVEARCCDYDWPFVAERAGEIAAHWDHLLKTKPGVWNGMILMMKVGRQDGARYVGEFFETRFAAMMAWHHLGRPEGARLGFPVGALTCRDGAYLLGVMAGHTANAGKVYFPSGNLDPGDVQPDGRIDMRAAYLRELTEETGLSASDVACGEGWVVAERDAWVAFFQDVWLDLDADEAVRLLRGDLAAKTDHELSDILIVRNRNDVPWDRLIPSHVSFFNHVFGA